MHETADRLSLPYSFADIGETLLVNLLFILILILVGTMVGGEYNLGTVRLLYTRGPTRLQYLFAKVATAIFCIVPAVLILTLVRVFLGQALYSVFGFSTSWSFVTPGWLVHTMLFILLIAFAWFAYALLALFFGILARSTVTAIIAPFIWNIVESVLRELINALVAGSSGPISLFFKAVPDYFIANNMIAFLDNQGRFVFSGDLSSLSTDRLILK